MKQFRRLYIKSYLLLCFRLQDHFHLQVLSFLPQYALYIGTRMTARLYHSLCDMKSFTVIMSIGYLYVADSDGVFHQTLRFTKSRLSLCGNFLFLLEGTFFDP